jgi:hypothetical protein
MKKFILVVLFLSFAIPCFADLYVIVDKTTKEVITVSEKNDTIPGANQELKIIQGNISDFTTENPTNYKFSGGKFVKNIDKISAQEQAKIEKEEKAQEEKIIQEKIRQISIDQLKSEGVELKWNK